MDVSTKKIQEQQKQFIEELKNLIGDLKKNIPELFHGDLKVEKGYRIIYGKSSRGDRKEIQLEDIKELRQLIKSQPTGNTKKAEERRSPNYLIKAGDEVIFRQERNGEVAINKFFDLEHSRDLNITPEQKQQPIETNAVLETEVNQESNQAKNAASLSQVGREENDRDRDGLNKREEIAQNTNPNLPDTDNDGKNDNFDQQPTRNEQNTVKLIGKEAEQLSIREAFKQLLETISREIKAKYKLLSDKAKNWQKVVKQWQQDNALADTAVSLHSKYNANANENYQADKYNISRSGQVYSISDRDNNVLLRFKKTPFGKEILINNLNSISYEDFKKASKTLSENRDLFRQKTQELDQLGDLIPQNAVILNREQNALQVTQTANKFLHYMGDNRKETKSYFLSVNENNTLTVEAKDGRGIILQVDNGQTKVNSLSQQDLEKFKTLDFKIEKRYEQIKQQQRVAKQAQKIPDRQRERTI